MKWIIQENLYNEEGMENLVTALQRRNIPHSIHKVVPFSHELIPDATPGDHGTIVMGAYTMIGIARDRGWTPGAYSNENFHFPLQIEKWGSRMLNNKAWVGRFEDVPPQEKPFFIRPTLDSKFFAGQTLDWEGFLTWKEKILNLGWEGSVTPDTEVMVCPLRKIYQEFRTWIVDGRAVTASRYIMGGRMSTSSDVDPSITLFAEECAKVWSPSSAYVLDVAETEDGLFILEVNCLNAAGFYKGDVGKIVEALEDLNNQSQQADGSP